MQMPTELCYSYIDDTFTKYFSKIENKLYICNPSSDQSPTPSTPRPEGNIPVSLLVQDVCFAQKIDALNLQRKVTNAYSLSISRRFLGHP